MCLQLSAMWWSTIYAKTNPYHCSGAAGCCPLGCEVFLRLLQPCELHESVVPDGVTDHLRYRLQVLARAYGMDHPSWLPGLDRCFLESIDLVIVLEKNPWWGIAGFRMLQGCWGRSEKESDSEE